MLFVVRVNYCSLYCRFQADATMKIFRPRCALLGSLLLLVPVMYVYSVVLARQWQQKQYVGDNSFKSTVTSHATYVDTQASFTSVVTGRASADKFIILTIVDEAVVDMAVNFYKSSFKPHNIDNFLFIGFGAQTCAKLSADSISCFRYMDFNGTSKASVYNSLEFLTKMAVRNRIILETLKTGLTVLLADMDIVFLQNPLPDLKVNDVNNWPTSRLMLANFAVYHKVFQTVLKR
jgi:Nucleotide-diphospho-sugar transferase